MEALATDPGDATLRRRPLATKSLGLTAAHASRGPIRTVMLYGFVRHFRAKLA